MMICTLTSVTYHAKNNDEMGKGKGEREEKIKKEWKSNSLTTLYKNKL